MKIVLFANTDWYLYNFRRSLVMALRDGGHDPLLISPPGPYGEKLRALGVRWQPVPMDRRSLNPVREARLLWHLFHLFRREQPDLVHTFTIKCAVYGSLVARAARVPARINAIAGMGYVFTSADRLARWLRPIVRVLLRLGLGGGNARLVVQNPDDAALFERAHLVEAGSIRLIPGSGVDCRRFAPGGGRAWDRTFRVLLPTRLLWDKGLAEYAQAARTLRSEGRGIEFLLAGEADSGNPADVPAVTIREWVQDGLLEWLGHVEDMPALLRSVDAVAFPSYREGLPKALIEAAASGLPLVTTDVPGCREVVSDGVHGWIVPARDSAALAAAIARLQDDPALAGKFGMAARERALSEFDERIVIRRTLDVYRELLGPAAIPVPVEV